MINNINKYLSKMRIPTHRVNYIIVEIFHWDHWVRKYTRDYNIIIYYPILMVLNQNCVRLKNCMTRT